VAIETVATPQKLLAFRMKVTPQVVLALLDERDALNERLAELEADLAGLAEDHQKATESIKQADAAVKLAHEKFSALAAENELARKAVQEFCDVVGDSTEVICEEIGRDGVLVILEAMKATGNMPATDAFLAEVRAQGVEMLAKNHQSIVNALKGDSLFSDGEYRHAAIVSAAVYFAAELRKGGNQ
ncbi:ead/Ea22-like family protein, partial [Escherichia coli]|nr:ead/Ea22-like family protein [Escherichia coli]EJR2894683.1 ead/Ea22-like family protein [Escherichia coli]